MGRPAHRRGFPSGTYFWLQLSRILGDILNNDQQNPQGQPGYQNPQGQPGHQDQPAYGQPPYPPRADQYTFGQPPYGDPGPGQFGQPPYGEPGPGQFGQSPPPKRGIPVWGWVAGGVGVVAVLAVAGVMVLGGLASGNTEEAAPGPVESSGSAEAGSPESEEATTDDSSAAPVDDATYLFEDADFTSAPVWSTAIPAGWTTSDVKGGTITYRNGENPCLFTTHQAILPPSGAVSDEEATMATMRSEIDGVKASAGSPVTVVSDAESLYTKLRNADGHGIELQEAELRFKNKNDVDLVFRMAVRSMPAGNGLMELTLACPANLPTESELWWELTDTVTMTDDPAA